MYLSFLADLRGKKVIITGGSKGIGREMALQFALYGADVIITGRNEEDLRRTTAELTTINPNCFHIRADVTNVDEIGSMVSHALQRFGKIDIHVNNAGINIPKPALEVTEEDWDRVLDTNLKGTFFCSQAVGKSMIEREIPGKIITIVSQMAFVGYVKRAAYCSSKGGAVQLTKALAIEWAKYNIKVNAVAPTFIETELTKKMFEDKQFFEDVLSRIPIGSLAKPEDVSNAVLFLASERANFITGETIRVDGGWTAI
jgi:NAD(P)-dependent dehydrogenase (short-subunit alcohol dehydrogenase family)